MNLPPLGPIRYLTIHCTATPEGRHHTAAEVTKWDVAKFGQPAYHWVIELDGKMVRTLKDTEKGSHTGGRNTGNIGISYVGGCDAKLRGKDTRTPAQRKSLATLVRTYQARYPGINVLGHHDWPNVTKACPSFDVAAWIKGGML